MTDWKVRSQSDSDEWIERHLWPFLSETNFVLSGGDLQHLGGLLLDADGVDHTPSWRHWGHTLAPWANQHWKARPSGLGLTDWSRAKRPWEYLDFYSYDNLSYLIADYDYWLEGLESVFRQNTAAT